MPDPSLDALIVGAGPVGLTMAAALNHQGLRCRLIEKTPAASDKSKALVMWARSLELLNGLSLADTFVAAGHKIRGGSVYADGERVVHLDLTGNESPFGFPLMIPQNETERLLTEHLAQQGIAVERQVELVTFQESATAVTCTLRHTDGREEAIDVPWLLGCDGAHSTVRHTLGLEFTGAAEPNDWLLADVHIAGPIATDEISAFWCENGVLVIFPMGNNRFRVVADTGAATNAPVKTEVTLADAQAKVDERGPVGLKLFDPIWLANFRINERKVANYRLGRIMLAGDAAHIHSPAGGQGMNTGMQDAFNLAWKLALVQRGLGQPDPLLESYSIERSAVGDQVLENASRFTTVATLRNPVAQWVRNHVAPIVSSFHFVQDKMRQDMWEMSINYRHSPLSENKWPALTGGLAAGDRMCDAPLTSPDGRLTTLFAETAGKGHTLLLLPATDATNDDPDAIPQLLLIAADVDHKFPGVAQAHLILRKDAAHISLASHTPAWFDSEGKLHDALHAASPTLVLVRPDGYIAYRAHPADGDALLAHMGRYLTVVR